MPMKTEVDRKVRGEELTTPIKEALSNLLRWSYRLEPDTNNPRNINMYIETQRKFPNQINIEVDLDKDYSKVIINSPPDLGSINSNKLRSALCKSFEKYNLEIAVSFCSTFPFFDMILKRPYL